MYCPEVVEDASTPSWSDAPSDACEAALFALARMAESRDAEMGEHLVRIRTYCQILAEQLGRQGPYVEQIDARFLADLYRASPLHDVGKMALPDALLLKPGRLTREEFGMMQRHTLTGAMALEEAALQCPGSTFLDMAAEVARHHHERFDGWGYPDGLAGQEISLASRIVALADVFDALTTRRVYKPAMPLGAATDVILGESGRHFDPAVVDAFRQRLDDILATAAAERPLAYALATGESAFESRR
jgi:putative two-component system response regulator